MLIGIPKETRSGETRVAMSPEVAKKLIKVGYEILVEQAAGESAGFPDSEFKKEGCKIGSNEDAFKAEIVWKVNKPSPAEILKMSKGCTFFSYLEPYNQD